MKRLTTLIVALTLSLSIFSAVTPATRVERSDASPFCFWYWMYGAVSKPAIHADLMAMKNVGLRGTYLMPIRGVNDKPEHGGKANQLTPEFWDMVSYAITQCDSLGLELGVHICDGFALAGGPWFTPEESMQKVVWSDTTIVVRDAKGRAKLANIPVSTILAKPKGEGYKDIAAYAIPVSYPQVTVSPVAFSSSDNVTHDEKSEARADGPCWFKYDFGKDVDIRSIEIHPSGTNIQCQRLSLSVCKDGESEPVKVKDFVPARQGWQNTGSATTFTLPAGTKARYFIFSWTPEGTEPGSEDLDAAKWKATLRLKAITFLQEPRIHQWEGKSAAAWRVADATTESDIPTSLCTPLEKMIPLTVAEDGTVILSSLRRPELLKDKSIVAWRIFRMGHASTGQTNATAGGGKGLECDKFSKAAVNKLVDNWFCQFTSRQATLRSGRHPMPYPIKYLHVDSWECGCQNWSSNFAEEFKARRGYDIIPWLPVMAGMPLVSAAETERVLRDVRLTINDLINDVFFATVRDRAHEMGMEFSSESVAPTMVADGIDHYRYADLPMGEYWLNSPTHDKPNDMLDAISGAHVYGKKIVQAEGFTEVRGVWDEDPASIKSLLDRNFALGMNRLFFHVNTHNPWLDRKPGMTLDGIGLFFQRDQIWFPEAKPFVDYITRCSALLQLGRPVQDIAVFTGDEMPRRAILPERLVPMLPGLFGKNFVEEENDRLANVGLPMEESPVGVNHSANIVDTRNTVNCLRGYQYDSFNPDVLLRLAKAEKRCMVLPCAAKEDGGITDGTIAAKYSVIVVPQKRPMNPEGIIADACHEKIEEMRRAGVIVIDRPYTEDDLSQYGIYRDVDAPEDIAYTHRSSSLGEIYFLSNQSEYGRETDIAFRDTLKGDAYIYDAVAHTYNRLSKSSDGEGYSINFDPYGSCFVLFPASGDINHLLAALPTTPTCLDNVPALGFKTAMNLRNFTIEPVEMKMEPTRVKLLTPSTLTCNGTMPLVKAPIGAEIWHGIVPMRYFSGHARYTTSFKLIKAPKGNETLDLGTVKNIAHVWVNGIDCGIVWTSPFKVKVGHALKWGVNNVTIEVVNTWANALRGLDEGNPPYEGIWTNARYRIKKFHLLPAGLLGPVNLCN